MWPNSYYASEVHTLAIPSLTGSMVAKASAVAKVPSFQWLDRNVTVDTLFSGTLADIRAANKAGANPPYAGIFVVYDLPDRDCAAAASNGEWAIANGGAANYRGYIDRIRQLIQQYSDIRILLVIEPDSLANMVTNMGVAKCSNAAATYKELTKYAIQQLNLPNVAMYLDAGHAGWLGWPANLQPAVDMFATLYKDAGKPAAVRGLATNVANYNAWNISSPPSYTSPNPNYDEIHYVQAMSPLLNAAGFNAHFITDTGRSGKQPTGTYYLPA
jgi:cellulose 1,4-beta-cellobiosidase